MTTAIDTNIALFTLAEAKEYLKITNSNDDVILSHLINGVSDAVASYLNRELMTKERTEYYTGDGSDELMLRVYPITAVDSIYIDNFRTFDASLSLIAATDYIIYKDSGLIKAFNLFGQWYHGKANIKVKYTAGYVAGSDAGTGSLPYGLRMAGKRLLDLHYRMGYSQRKLDYTSESISQQNYTYNFKEIPDDVKSMLDGFQGRITPQFAYAD